MIHHQYSGKARRFSTPLITHRRSLLSNSRSSKEDSTGRDEEGGSHLGFELGLSFGVSEEWWFLGRYYLGQALLSIWIYVGCVGVNERERPVHELKKIA